MNRSLVSPISLVTLVVPFFGSGCGSVDGPGDIPSNGGNGSPPDSVTLSVEGATIKSIEFSWTPVPGVASYTIIGEPGEGSTGGQLEKELGPDTTSTAIELPVHLMEWVDGVFLVRACNDAGCSDSEPISVSDFMPESIGYFKAFTAFRGAYFGIVKLSGDGATMAVGAGGGSGDSSCVNGDRPKSDKTDPGEVYVFRKVEGEWSQEACVMASNGDHFDSFGSDLALSHDGNTLAVGASGESSADRDDPSNNDLEQSGAVYVFSRDDGSWSQEAYLKAGLLQERAGLASLSLSDDGNVLAAGWRRGGDEGAGTVDLYVREQGAWSAEDTFYGGPTADSFGSDVSLSADAQTLAVGAPNRDAKMGAAYVFARTQDGWVEEGYLQAFNGEPEDRFGWSLALSADGRTLAVGADGEDSSSTEIDGDGQNNDAERAGAVYVFTRSSAGWSQQAYVKASNTDERDGFHAPALSADGNTLVVGATGEQSMSAGIGGDQTRNDFEYGAGAAYVYKRAGDTWTFVNYVKATNPGEQDAFGNALSLSADGLTLAIGAQSENGTSSGINGIQDDPDGNMFSYGAVYLY